MLVRCLPPRSGVRRWINWCLDSYKKNGFGGKGIFSKENVIDIVKIIVDCAAMTVTVAALMNFVDFGNSAVMRFAELVLTAAAGMVVYLILGFVLKIDEFSMVVTALRKRGE